MRSTNSSIRPFSPGRISESNPERAGSCSIGRWGLCGVMRDGELLEEGFEISRCRRRRFRIFERLSKRDTW